MENKESVHNFKSKGCMEYVENLIFIDLYALYFILLRPLDKKKTKVASQEYIS